MPANSEPVCTNLSRQLARREDQLAAVRSRLVGMWNALREAQTPVTVDTERWDHTRDEVRFNVRGIAMTIKRERLGLRQGFEILIYHPAVPEGCPVATVFVPDATDGPVRAQAMELVCGGPLADPIG